jgi:hypothetical protein
MASFTDEAIPVVRNSSTRTVSKLTNWYCKYCGETDPNDHAGFGDWSKYEENERVLKANQKFLKFVEGKDPNAPVKSGHE